ncbi:MAG: hldE [Pedosphaera sp.]|nr:hldE [Pedosphaera sp.]
MNPDRFRAITSRYAGLRIAVVGDYSLDRYLDIDPAKAEISIETGQGVHNVIDVRPQAGAAGTIVNNLSALRVGSIFPVGFCGDDGEGYELRRALAALKGVQPEHFFATPLRRTFTYCKPLILEAGQPPRELNRLDSKNWTPTPHSVTERILQSLAQLRSNLDALIIMDQVDVAGTGVITPQILAALPMISGKLLTLADSRRGLRDYPPVCFKMNAGELGSLVKLSGSPDLAEIKNAAANLAVQGGRAVFITLAERGIIGAQPGAPAEHLPALPVRGPIDVVGAGDSVTANLTTALAAGATLREAMELALVAASLVIHQLGTTGVATVTDLESLVRYA